VRTAVRALLDCVAAPFDAGGIRVRLTMRIGCALAPEHADEAQTLVQQAGIALRAPAPAGSGAWQLYRPDMWRRSLRNLVLLSDLPRAIVSGELVLHYQPLLDLATRTTVGAEALVRWRHPRDGLLPPADFIALAEESGEIEALGRWVADEALRQHAAWRAAGLAPGGIAVHVSPSEVLAGGLPDALAALASRHGVPPGEVTVELTEGTFLDDPERAIAELGRLREAGFGIAIDDFGTGYSAFALLVRLPVTGLKIDRSFVLGLGGDTTST
jgi:EAL domain-containing protein (putative c-di-GMP-specific phosphodiesterase class I)